MADRTSAGLFAIIFKELAKEEPIDRRKLAEILWKETSKYDFSSYQLECDDTLIKLDLADKCAACGSIRYGADDGEREDDHWRYCEKRKS